MYKNVGIPRALYYHKYFPLWRSFLEELGAEITVSDATNKKIMDDGVKSCVDEACLPIKLFHGHVLNLAGRVDCLFIPRLTSISRNEYICPQIGGLPDTIRNRIKGLPPIISTEVNLRKSKKNTWKIACDIGYKFTSDKRVIEKAFIRAVNVYRDFRRKVKQGDASNTSIKDSKQNLKIALIGHPYNLYDSYINMDMLNKLNKKGISIITIEMIEESIINKNVADLQKPIFWNFGRKALGSAIHMSKDMGIDGMIYIMSFGCGIDAFVCDLLRRRLKADTDIPFILITIDEHTGEAGINTRLEAFIDMLEWRKKNENNIPSFG